MNYRQIYARKAEWKTLKNEMEAKEEWQLSEKESITESAVFVDAYTNNQK